MDLASRISGCVGVRPGPRARGYAASAFLLVAFGASVLTGTSVPSQPATPYRFEQIAQIGGASHAVVADSGRAYLGVGPRLLVLDISDPEDPRLLGQSEPLPGVVRDVALVRDHAFVAVTNGVPEVRRGAVVVINVVESSRPQVIGQVPLETTPTGIDVAGAFGVVVGHLAPLVGDFEDRGTFQVIDFSSLAMPRVAASLDLDDPAADVAVMGSAAVVLEAPSSEFTTLRTIDISDPTSPRRLAITSFPGEPSHLAAVDGRVYVASYAGLWVVDVSSPDAPREIGRLGLPSFGECASGVAVSGQRLALVDTCAQAVRFIDVTDPERPRQSDRLALTSPGAGVDWWGEHVYVTAGLAGGVHVVAASDPTQPRAVASFETYGAIQSLDVNTLNGAVYGAHPRLGLAVIADPSSPPRAPIRADVPNAADVLVVAGHAYVSAGRTGQPHVFDVSDSDQLREVGVTDVAGTPMGIRTDNAGHVFIAAGQAGLRILDISQPEHPREFGADASEPVGLLEVLGNRVYTAFGETLRVLDASNPTAPHPVGETRFAPLTAIVALAAGGNYAYAIEGEGISQPSGLNVVDVSQPAAPRQVDYFSEFYGRFPRHLLGLTEGLFIASTRGVTAVKVPARTPLEVLASLDTPEPAATRTVTPRPSAAPTRQIVSSLYLPRADNGTGKSSRDWDLAFVTQIGGPTWDLAVTGDLVFRGEGPCLVVLDASDPSRIREIGRSEAFGGIVFGVAVTGSHAFVAAAEAGLSILDVSNPTEPRLVGWIDTRGAARDVVVADGHAYVAASDAGLRVIDVNDPAHPSEVGAIQLPGRAWLLDYDRGFVYAVLEGWDSLAHVIDVRDPQAPVEVATLGDDGSVYDLAILGQYAYAVEASNMIAIYDVSDPTAPAVLGSDFDFKVDLLHIEVVGALAFAGTGGLNVLDVSDPLNPTLLTTMETNGLIESIAPSGHRLFLATASDLEGADYGYASGAGPLIVADVADPTGPGILGEYYGVVERASGNSGETKACSSIDRPAIAAWTASACSGVIAWASLRPRMQRDRTFRTSYIVSIGVANCTRLAA